MHALLSYITAPFSDSVNRYHTNHLEARIIASTIAKNGYSVDVVDFNSEVNIDYSKYALVVGFGGPFRRSIKYKKPLKVYYATGSSHHFQNTMEIIRTVQVNMKFNSNLLPERYVEFPDELEINFSDAIILLGNKQTKSSFDLINDIPIYLINASGLEFLTRFSSIEIRQRKRNHFLYFAGSGPILKGMDILLEAFHLRQDLTLHICGYISDDFANVFKSLMNGQNIVFYGLIDVNSQDFLRLSKLCAFALFPSCSEGQSTSLLTCLRAYLPVVATRYCGVDLDGIGFELDQINTFSLLRVLRLIDELREQDYETMSDNAKTIGESRHSITAFEIGFSRALSDIIENRSRI